MQNTVSYQKQRWGILAVLSFYAFTVFVALHTLTPVLSLVIEDLGISHAQSGLLVAVFSLPSILFIIPVSYFVSRIGIKRLGIISISLMLAGSLLMLMAKSFPAFLAGRVIIGIGAVAVPFVGLQGVAQWFRGNHLGLAMGIYSTAMIGSTIFALNLYSVVASHYGWMTDLWITAALAAVSLILFILFFRLPPRHEETQVDVKSTGLRRLRDVGLPLWLLGLCWGIFNLGMMSLVVFTPDFLYSNGFSLVEAGSITSVIIIINTALSSFVGLLVDRIRFKELINIVGAMSTCILVYLLPSNVDKIILFMVIIGIFTTPFAAVTFSLVPSLVKSSMIPLAYAIIATTQNLGLFLGPYFTGLVRDISGSYNFSYVFLALVFFIVVLLNVATVWMRRRHNTLINGNNSA